MNADLTSVGKGSFLSALASISDKGLTRKGPGNSDQLIDFSEILASQDALTGIIDQLRELLPEQAYTQLESLLAGGNDLPQPAVVTGIQPIEPVPIDIESLFSMLGLTPLPGEAAPVTALPTAIEQTSIDPGTQVITGSNIIRNLFKQQPAEGLKNAPLDPNILKSEASMPAATLPNIPTNGFEAVQGRSEPVVRQSLPDNIESTLSFRNSALTGAGQDSVLSLIPESRILPLETQVRSLLQTPADLTRPVGEKGWDRGLGDRILWMVGRSIQSASLHVTPPRLGPVEIQLSMHQDQASVSFITHNNAVKEALEAAIPRLREMFSDSNLQLVNVDVGQREAGGQRALAEGFNGQQDSPGNDRNLSGGRTEQQEEDVSPHESSQGISGLGLLDDYA